MSSGAEFTEQLAVDDDAPTAAHRIIGGCVLAILVCGVIAIIVGAQSANADSEFSIKAFHTYMLPPDGAKVTAPRAVHVGPEGEIYVLDDIGRVLVLGDGGKVIRQWRMPESEIGRPEGICFLQDGTIVVADTHYDRLVYFDAAGKVLKYQGKHGTGPGEFAYPVAVIQDPDGFIYTAEYGDEQRVQKFTADGEYVLEFGKPGTGAGQFQRPSGLIWQDGEVFVVDAFNNRIQHFTDTGKLIGVLDETDKTPALEYPYDIAKADDGSMYVVEYQSGCVTHLSPSGALLGKYGSTGRGDGQFVTPWGIAWRKTANSIIVADTGNRRVVEIEL